MTGTTKNAQLEAEDVKQALIELMGAACENCGDRYDDCGVLERCELALQDMGYLPPTVGLCDYCYHAESPGA